MSNYVARCILYRNRPSRKTSIFAFTRSETGILDYSGDVSKDYEGDVCKKYNDVKKMQRVDSSLYFSPTRYTNLHKDYAANISVYIPKNIRNLNTNQYSFLVHIGAVLLAIQEKDSLLVAEALFAWVYGSFKGAGKFTQFYNSEDPVKTGETDTAAILRKARPSQYTYKASLVRIGGTPTWPDNAIVIRLKL